MGSREWVHANGFTRMGSREWVHANGFTRMGSREGAKSAKSAKVGLCVVALSTTPSRRDSAGRLLFLTRTREGHEEREAAAVLRVGLPDSVSADSWWRLSLLTRIREWREAPRPTFADFAHFARSRELPQNTPNPPYPNTRMARRNPTPHSRTSRVRVNSQKTQRTCLTPIREWREEPHPTFAHFARSRELPQNTPNPPCPNTRMARRTPPHIRALRAFA
jgi:hypothetical protein